MAMGMEEMHHEVENIQKDQDDFIRNQEVIIRDMSTNFGFPLMAIHSNTKRHLSFPRMTTLPKMEERMVRYMLLYVFSTLYAL